MLSLRLQLYLVNKWEVLEMGERGILGWRFEVQCLKCLAIF